MSNKFYTNISREFVSRFNDEVIKAGSIVVVTHMGPDDDAISSLLATYTYLVDILKVKGEVEMMITGKVEDKWEYFQYFDKVTFVDDISRHIDGVDLLINLDSPSWHRVSNSDENFSGQTICIDHHASKDGRMKLHMLVDNMTSTAELVYHLFFEHEKKLSKEVCETLFLGISGDTGNFNYITPDQLSVFDVVKRIMREGNIKIELLKSKYRGMTKEQYEGFSPLYAHTLDNSKIYSIKGWPNFMTSYVDRDFLEQSKLSFEDAGTAVHFFGGKFLKSVIDVPWGFVARPSDKGRTSITLRSLPRSVNVREFAERLEIGGGHDRAAGGRMDVVNTKQAIEKIIDWMKKNEPTFS